ncbi:MAG: zinc-ribbon domain-containing protein [Oscillospiraceae bacterium]|nr:zinc-ribbon domain-containing protein [Oscillospiraceae bacterium]
MYCANCGAKLDEGSKFCHNCGAPVQAAQPVTQQPAPAAAAPQQPVQASVSTEEIPVIQAEFIPEPSAPAQQPAQPVPYTAPVYQAPPQPAADNPGSISGEIPSYPSPAPSKANGGKKAGRAIIAVIAILAVLAGGYFVLFGKGKGVLPVGDPAEKGKEAYEAGDYETAVEYLEKAYEKDPSNPEVGEMLYTSYQTLMLERYNERDYEATEKYLIKMDGLYGGSDDLFHILYTEWLNRIMYGTEVADPYEILSRSDIYLTDEERDFYSSFFSVPADLEELAVRIADFYDKAYHPGACLLTNYYESIIDNAMKDSGSSSCLFSVEGHKYDTVIFRPKNSESGYKVYYGTIDSTGQRNGTGILYCYVKNSGDPYLYYYLCNWADDLPNGQFAELVRKGDGFSITNTYTGTLVDGHYDGYIKEVFDDGVEYQSQYDKGLIIPIRIDDQGRTVIGVATDGSDKYLYSTASDDTILYGVDEY